MSYLEESEDEKTFEGFVKEKKEKNAIGTIRGFETMFKLFDNFCLSEYQKGMHQIITDIKANPEKRVWSVLKKWIKYQKENGLGSNTIHTRFSLFKKYLSWMDIKLDPNDIENKLTLPTIDKDKKYALKLDDIHKIFAVASYDKKVLYLCQISSLARIGELCLLRKRDLDLSTERITVTIRAKTTKKKTERTTFFSKEASSLIRAKIKNLSDDDLIFPHSVKLLSNAGTMEQQTLGEYLVKVGLDMKYETSGRFKISTHSFRAYGITKLKRVDPALAYFLAGHKDKVYMEFYDRLKDDPEELYKAYVQAEPHLLVLHPKTDDSDEIKKLKEEMQELKSLNERNYDIMKLVSQGLVTIRPGDEKSDIYIDNRKHNKFLKERDEEYNKDHEEYMKNKK